MNYTEIKFLKNDTNIYFKNNWITYTIYSSECLKHNLCKTYFIVPPSPPDAPLPRIVVPLSIWQARHLSLIPHIQTVINFIDFTFKISTESIHSLHLYTYHANPTGCFSSAMQQNGPWVCPPIQSSWIFAVHSQNPEFPRQWHVWVTGAQGARCTTQSLARWKLL